MLLLLLASTEASSIIKDTLADFSLAPLAVAVKSMKAAALAVAAVPTNSVSGDPSEGLIEGHRTILR